MKYLNYILFVILFIAIGFIIYNQYQHEDKIQRAMHMVDTSANKPVRVAYIDMDSIEANYDYFKIKTDEINKEEENIDKQLNNTFNVWEKRRQDLIKKGNAATQAEVEKFQQDYSRAMQDLDTKKNTLYQQHMDKRTKSINDILKRINDYLKEYNKVNNYSFIFTTSRDNMLLIYKDTAYNITPQVIKGLNEEYRADEKK